MSEQAYQRIIKAVEAVGECRRGFWDLNLSGTHYHIEGCGCPMAAVLNNTPNRPGTTILEEAALVLGVSFDWADGFIDGFDGSDSYRSSLDSLAGFEAGDRAYKELQSKGLISPFEPRTKENTYEP